MSQDFVLAVIAGSIVLGLLIAVCRVLRAALDGDDGRPSHREDGQGISPFDPNIDSIRHNGRHDGSHFRGGD